MNYRLFSVVFLVPFFYFQGGVADDVSSKEKIIAYLKLGKSNKEIAELCEVSVRTVERYKKSLTTSDNDTKNDKRQNDRIKREQAKILVEEGATIREASEETGVKESTLYNYSSKENWIQSQKEFSQRVYNELQARHLNDHLQRKETALGYLDLITEMTIEKLRENEISVDKAVNTIMASIRGQNDILGILSTKSIIDIEIALEDLDIKKRKLGDKDENENQVLEYMKVLKEVLKNGRE